MQNDSPHIIFKTLRRFSIYNFRKLSKTNRESVLDLKFRSLSARLVLARPFHQLLQLDVLLPEQNYVQWKLKNVTIFSQLSLLISATFTTITNLYLP